MTSFHLRFVFIPLSLAVWSCYPLRIRSRHPVSGPANLQRGHCLKRLVQYRVIIDTEYTVRGV